MLRVLYTHQKMKKSKVWQDGILKTTHLGNKVKPGDDLESDRYLITVEDFKVAGSIGVKEDVIKEAPHLNSRFKSGRSLGCQPAGLKRKFTGFQGPREVPKKMVITENGESAASSEAKKLGSVFLSPLYSTLPLFSTVGKKDINNMLTDSENIVTGKNRERNFSSLVCTPSFKINQEMLCEENYFCPPVSSVNKYSYSLLTNEGMKRDRLALGVSQNIRSKAQILALLKSESTSVCKELNSEVLQQFPQIQLQESINIPTKPKSLIEQEECAEVKSTESLYYQHQSEGTMRNKSWWATYLSSESSPIHSPEDGNNIRKPKAQGDDINLDLKDFLVQKGIQFFETCAEKGKEYNKDKSVDNDQFQDQEVKLEIPSFYENSSLPVTCSNVENDALLSELDSQENNKMPVNQNDQLCIKGSILIRENAQERNTHGTPEKKYKQPVLYLPESDHLKIESSLNNNSRISDGIADMFSKSNTDSESLNGNHESMNNATQPLVEVTFNLNNFETSDTEEESQGSNKVSHDSEGFWVQETLVNDISSCVQKGCKDISCKEGDSEHLSLLTSVGNKSKETFPVKETLLSQFCDKVRVDFDTGPWKAGNTGKEIEERTDTLGNFDSSLKWTDDNVDNEDAHKSIQKVITNYDFASFSNKSKAINTNLYIPHFVNIATNHIPVNNLFSEQVKPQPFIKGSDLDKNNEQVLPSTSNRDISIQLLNANQNHSEECITLDKSNSQVSNSLFYPLGEKHPIPKDTEACIPESEDLEGIKSLHHDHIEIEDGESRQCWNSARNSSELSDLVNNISLLKSLSEYSTALDGLEILRKKTTTFKQQGSLRTYEPDSNPEARKPLTTVVSQAIPKSHLNQDSPQFFSLGSKEEMTFVAVTPKQIERKTCDSKPVEFQGHQVKGSATSAVMVRGDSSQLECTQFPDSTEGGNCMTDTCFLTPELPSTCMQTDFLQVSSPEQKNSALSPVSTFSLNSRDEDFMLEFSEESLKAGTLPVMKKSTFLENKNLPRLPLVSRTQVPLTTLPPADGLPGLDSCSYVISCDRKESSGSPIFNLCEEAAFLSFSFGPEDQSETSFSREPREVTPGDASLLDNISTESKWLKYQNIPQCNLTTTNRVDKVTDGPFAEADAGMHFSVTGERQSNAANESSSDSVRLQMIKGMLHQQQQDFSSQDLVSRKKTLSLNLKQTSRTEETQNALGESACYNYSVTGDLQEINGSELCFPSGQKIKSAYLPPRQIHIPAVFQSPAHYKQIFTSCLIEHLNILLFGLAQRLYKALSKVDISFYTSSKGEKLKDLENSVPSCHHHQPAKLVMVKKEGPNKGRLFYTCDGPKADRCKFFKWLEEVTPRYLTQEKSLPSMVLSDMKSVALYLRSQNIPLYEECQLLVRKRYGKLKKFTTANPEFYDEPKSKLYLKLSRKESSSTYSKNDLWVVSKTVDFELDTFIACSAFFGPSSISEVELLPLKGYFPSNWPTNMVVHALLVCNASTELTTLKNIQDYFNPATLPLTQYLLTMSSSTPVSNKRVNKRKFIPPAFSNVNTKSELLSLEATLQLASELIQAHKLNEGQARALIQIAQMMASHRNAEGGKELRTHTLPVTIIHGVFGAGKSYLLAVVILFFVQLFEKSEIPAVGNARPWKLLISSATNRVYVRKSIEQHKLGTNKTLLRQISFIPINGEHFL
ncbi:hypothetical protein MC885_018914 [Smutsia gigantea]|nr:hypothetical protein MC885_018914 [Smutsia gigantea]